MRLTKAATRQGLRIATWEASAAAIHNALVSLPFLTGFLLAWGARDLHVGLAGAMMFLGAPFQLLGAYVADRWPQHRRFSVALFGLMARGTWLLAAVIPVAFRHSPAIVIYGFLALYLFHQTMYHASTPGWMAWMAVLVPGRVRGRYLGRRSRAMELCGMATLLAAGAILDFAREAGYERLGFSLLYLGAGLSGIACFVLLMRQADPGHQSEPPEYHVNYLLRPLREQRFRKLFYFNLAWLSGTAFCAPFYHAHLLKNMGWDFKRIAVLGLLTAFVSMATYAWWGHQQDRLGGKTVLMLCAVGLLTIPLLYVFCPWCAKWPVYLHHLLQGGLLSGFTLAMLGLTLESLPANGRAIGAAVMAAGAGPAIFAAGALGGHAAEILEPFAVSHGSLRIGHYQMLFIASIALRLPALVLLKRLANKGTP
ncbi:MAG: MFS transporter [Kiritimatiellae bacterium]|nr:MFS transporter [Kiritimatiellia bacterium]